MKTKLLFAAAIATLGATLIFQSCDKIKGAVHIPDIPLTGASADIVIPMSAAGSAGDIATVVFPYNIDSLIADQTKSSPIKISYTDIKSVKLTSVVLTLSDADATNSFDNFQTVGAAFNTTATPGSPVYDLTLIDPNPAGFNASLDMPLLSKDKDLKPYFNNGNLMITYVITGTLRTAITHELHCHIDVSYEIGF